MRKKTHNKSLHWIFTPLRSVKTSEFNRYAVPRIEIVDECGTCNHSRKKLVYCYVQLTFT